jgi:uncharacterized protein YigA (DUF484 family)
VSQKEPTLGLSSATVTAEEVASYLKSHPDFFNEAAHLLSEINVPHPQSGQAISLVERQAGVLRDRIKTMELKLADLLRHGQENDAISASMQRWIRGLFLHANPATMPEFLADSLSQIFNVPQTAIVIWRPRAEYVQSNWVVAESTDYVESIHGMRVPVCGPAALSPVARLLPEAGRDCGSMAVLPLRVGAAPEAFGVLVLGSPDARRFAPDLGVAFLERIAEIASAALSAVAKAGAEAA